MKRTEQIASLRRSSTRIARFIDQLMRQTLACCPVTVQQCYALEAVADGPRSMKDLAAQVGLHQSTLTRIVAKLERQNLVRRIRRPDNLRCVEVEITEAGRETCLDLDREGTQMCSALLDMIPEAKRDCVVEALDFLGDTFSPENGAFREVLRGCCVGKPDGGGGP